MAEAQQCRPCQQYCNFAHSPSSCVRAAQAKEARDLALCEQHFQAMGWRDEGPDGSVATDELLAALLRRAKHFKTEHDKQREKEKQQHQQQGAPVVVAWDSPPWR